MPGVLYFLDFSDFLASGFGSLLPFFFEGRQPHPQSFFSFFAIFITSFV
jgi:uncharacterized membrane protein YjjP (DUF1212 family)